MDSANVAKMSNFGILSGILSLLCRALKDLLRWIIQ